MKKLILAFCVSILLCAAALSEAPDFSGMTDAEILDIINTGRNAMVLQNIDDGLYRFETDARITIVFEKIDECNLDGHFVLEMTIINDSDIDYEIRTNEIYVNGWKVSTHNADISANRRAKQSWFIRYAEASIASIDEVEDIEIRLCIYPQGGNRKKDALDVPPVIISIK